MNYDYNNRRGRYETYLHAQNGRHSSKPSHVYPVIRLPLKFKSLAGHTANVYQKQNNDKLSFLITIDEEVGNLVATNDVDKRLSALENRTDTFIQFISAIKGYSYPTPIQKRSARVKIKA